jgi:uncharacterized protein with PIN domain
LKNPAELPDTLALDSSVFIAYFLGEKTGQLVKDKILANEGRSSSCSHLALAETFYVLCRERSREYAQQALELLEKTNYVTVHESASLDYLAAGYRCQRSISLGDCYAIGLAETIRGSAVFVRREKDLRLEMDKRPFTVGLVFLEELVKRQVETGPIP